MRPWLLFGVLVATGGVVAAPVPKGVKKCASLDGTWQLIEAVYDQSPVDVSRGDLWQFEGEWF